MKLYFELGERRHVHLEIYSCKNENFKIISAEWELIKYGEVESAGDCNIMDHLLDMLIQPNEKGYYKLKVIYQIGDETLIDIVEIQVTGDLYGGKYIC